MRRSFLSLATALGLMGCSFMHQVRVENVSDAPVTISYKLRTSPWHQGIFMANPLVERKQGRTFRTDTTVMIDPRDNMVTLTLAPGDRAMLARCINCTFEHLALTDSADAWGDEALDRHLNLYWMRIEQNGKSETYTPKQLVDLATKRKLQLTLLRISG